MKKQEFEFAAPGPFARLLPLLIGAGLPLIVIAVVALHPQRTAWAQVLPALLVLPLVAGILAFAMHRRKLVLEGDRISYHFIPWRNARLSELDLDAARIVDLAQERALQPVFRLFGSALPGYRSGWFRLRNRTTAYVVLSDWRRVLVLPRRDGKLLLFSLQKPDAVLDALRRG